MLLSISKTKYSAMCLSMLLRVRLIELLFLDGRLDERHDVAKVLAHRFANRLIFVRINQRPDTLVREHLGQQTFVHLAADDVHARDAALAGAGARAAPWTSSRGAILSAEFFNATSSSLTDIWGTTLPSISRPFALPMNISFTAPSSRAISTATASEFRR